MVLFPSASMKTFGELKPLSLFLANFGDKQHFAIKCFYKVEKDEPPLIRALVLGPETHWGFSYIKDVKDNVKTLYIDSIFKFDIDIISERISFDMPGKGTAGTQIIITDKYTFLRISGNSTQVHKPAFMCLETGELQDNYPNEPVSVVPNWKLFLGDPSDVSRVKLFSSKDI